MSWHLQHPPALWMGCLLIMVGIGLVFAGEIGWIIALPFFAAGLGSLAAAFTVVEGG